MLLTIDQVHLYLLPVYHRNSSLSIESQHNIWPSHNGWELGYNGVKFDIEGAMLVIHKPEALMVRLIFWCVNDGLAMIPSAAKVGDNYQTVVVTALHGIPIDTSDKGQERLRCGISHLNVGGLHCLE